MTLHIIASNNANALHNALSLIQQQDDILYIQDGVFQLLREHIYHKNIYALNDCIHNRAISLLIPTQIDIIDIDRWVDLSVKHNNSITWR
jgi:sulfur relay protein TusB/DsrH